MATALSLFHFSTFSLLFGDAFDDVIVRDPRNEEPHPAFFRLLYSDADARCAIASRCDTHDLGLYFDRNAIGLVRPNVEALTLSDRLVQLKESSQGGYIVCFRGLAPCGTVVRPA